MIYIELINLIDTMTCVYFLFLSDICCETMIIDHKRDELVYPLAWLPYVQDRIYFSIDGDHDVVISLSKHTRPIDPRYLLGKFMLFQHKKEENKLKPIYYVMNMRLLSTADCIKYVQ